ncbi:MAG: hypothetical protein IPK70_01070 [Flavobacteriales bacterium]|nr:hypothetical protein [Flavobacteriales bacterium]
MKNLIATFALSLFAIGAQAQQQTPIDSKQPNATAEIASISAGLKEAYGTLSRELAHLGREIGPDATKATAEQTALKARMEQSLLQLEGMLTTVNDPSAASQWTEVVAKAEMVRKNASAIVEERKAKR